MSVITTIDNRIAQIALDRPAKRNTLDSAMCEELARSIRDCDADSNVRVMVLTGQSSVFCAGLDLEEQKKNSESMLKSFDKVIEALRIAKKPIIAVVNGPAVAQGAELLYHCDFVYCGTHALFSIPSIALGLTPQYGTTLLAVKSAGYKLAAQKLLLSEPITPPEAVAMGLVNNVFEDDKLLEQSMITAARLCALPPKALLATKQLLKTAYLREIDEQCAMEKQAFDELIDGEERREAFAAFLEQRRPNFD